MIRLLLYSRAVSIFFMGAFLLQMCGLICAFQLSSISIHNDGHDRRAAGMKEE